MDFLHGMDDENAAPEETPPMEPSMLEDDVRIRREYLYLFENATVVEAMLIAPSHMQMSVCYLNGVMSSRATLS